VAFEKECIMRCSSAEWIARSEMMPSWCRQVNWGNCGIPWMNCAFFCERRLERTVLRPALLPVKTAQFTQFFRQVWRHTGKSLSLTECMGRVTWCGGLLSSGMLRGLCCQLVDDVTGQPAWFKWLDVSEEGQHCLHHQSD